MSKKGLVTIATVTPAVAEFEGQAPSVAEDDMVPYPQHVPYPRVVSPVVLPGPAMTFETRQGPERSGIGNKKNR